MKNPGVREAFEHLPRLVVFAEVAEHGTFRAAAEVLGLSPSTVTHHVQKLEAAMGVRLLERTSRAVALTSAGTTLLAQARELLETWRRGTSLARGQVSEPTGTLVVTAPDVIVERFVAPVLAQMVVRYPRLNIDLWVSANTLDLIDEGIHVAIRVGPLPDSGYGARPLWRDKIGVFASPECISKPIHTPADLDGVPWLQFSVRRDFLELQHEGGRVVSLKDSPRIRVNTGAAKLQLALAGAGFAQFPTRLVAKEEREGTLRRVLPEWTTGAADFYAVTPSPRPVHAAVRAFIDMLEHAAGKPTLPRLESK